MMSLGLSLGIPSVLKPPSSPVTMDRTVVLITGCSSGIGLHLAVRLASDPSRSFKVYATLRDLKSQGPLLEAARARACPPDALETLELDVRDVDSIAKARARVIEGRVDVLVCNAGRGMFGPLEAHDLDAMGTVVDVNVLGTVRVLQAFMPDMKRRRSGRILVTASFGGLMGLPFYALYCATKFALEGLCESLAVLLLPFRVHMSLIECGPVHTAFQEKLEGGPGGALDRADAQTRHLFSLFQRHLQHAGPKVQDPEEVIEVFLTALRAPRPSLRYFSTESLMPLARMRLEDPSGCSYLAAMHQIFADKQGEDSEAQEGPVGDPGLGPSAAPK
ncbi:17-beta-hydroxysteroid dehydrogenase type 1 [Perognathus longimembris pacificus]|uniref:17-beta-hydroxysteroid dehydrogenase type 1 n=1 Tax=Perognathus longimembris pacificus TaxID=214514 RepID=UPI0020193678|nr:17-beta-hydroxysteroid dehydrogenase type 1 [Perognathus longimembris pacificus]